MHEGKYISDAAYKVMGNEIKQICSLLAAICLTAKQPQQTDGE